MSFAERGGDVWAWRVPVSGTCACGGGCDAVTIAVNGVGPTEQASLRGNRFRAIVALREGENEIVASCATGDGRQLESDPLVLTERLREVPTAEIDPAVHAGTVELDASASLPSPGSRSALVSYDWSVRPTNPAPLSLRPAGDTIGTRMTADPPPVDGEYYVTVKVTDAAGRSDESTTYFVVRNGSPRLVDMDTESPAWVDPAVVYGVVPFLFGNDGFRSVEARLPYLAHLGINAIWLSPINSTPPGDYGYAVTDYFGLNPNYGTREEFRHLVETAHDLGIRVLMDFVPNHTSDEHPYFLDAMRYGASSRYYDFYDRDAAGRPTHYFDWTNLPNLDYGNPEVRRMILEAFSYWVREFDVDGFRVDVAWGVKRRDSGFWPVWRRTLKRIKPDLLLLAEGTARDPYYFSNGFDAAYDWTEHPGSWAWQGVFDSDTTIVPYLDAALTDLGHGYPDDALVFRFLNNNDTGQRFMSRYGTDKTRVASALLFTLPGIPELFTGDEVGASYLPYSDEYPISWTDQFGLRDYYRKLIALREAWPALYSRSWEPLGAEPATGVYAYVRWGEPGDAPVLVVLNLSGLPLTATVPVSGPAAPFGHGRPLRDLLTGDTLRPRAGSSIELRMPAWSSLILVEGRS